MPNARVKDLTPYRQPLVTSLGIILGFLLNFLASWSTRDHPGSEVENRADWLVVSTLLPSIGLMLFVLYRILDSRHAPDELERIYISTLRLYMSAVVLAFCGVGVAVFF